MASGGFNSPRLHCEDYRSSTLIIKQPNPSVIFESKKEGSTRKNLRG